MLIPKIQLQCFILIFAISHNITSSSDTIYITNQISLEHPISQYTGIRIKSNQQNHNINYSPMKERVAVIDNGTGYTKMGWAGNERPAFDIPTLIADMPNTGRVPAINSSRKVIDTLDFFIGDEASQAYQTHRVVNPIKGGIVRDWDMMQRFWHRCILDYLRCDPEQTVFVLTQPPLNPPENRQQVAEIMFETFNSKGLYIGVQAVMALISSTGLNSQLSLTGTVLDSGDGVTHVIPISDGFVIGSCIKHIPLAGSDITTLVANMVRERNEKFPIEDLQKIAKTIKEKFGYVVEDGNLVKEFKLFDARRLDPKMNKKFDKFVEGLYPNKQPYKVSVGYQRFLGPEMFFHPEIVDPKYRQSIDEIIDKAIQFSPIDSRRKLYDNIVLSGGSTMFPGLIPRLQKNLQTRVNERLDKYRKMNGADPKPIKVQVVENAYQRYAVWQGGSLLATMPTFNKMYHSRQEYFERGSNIARYNAVYVSGM